MSTKPTRQQDKGANHLVQALLLITEAARLDGRSPLNTQDLAELAQKIARVSTAFNLDEILARALESRGQSLGLRSGTAELITLIEEGVEPVATLLLNDDEFKELVARAEAELGDV
jgi:hypothetical protein